MRKVSYASVHAPIFVPGLGHLKDTLLDHDTPTNKACDMTLVDAGIIVKVGRYELLVPYTQFKVIVLKPEEPPKK